MFFHYFSPMLVLNGSQTSNTLIEPRERTSHAL
nr:MAG TPA: hypothetical protein [Caudoviricetes sp.]